MNAAGKRRGALVVEEGTIVIQTDVLGESIPQESPTQQLLVGFRVWMPGMPTGVAIDTDMAVNVQDIDNGHLAQARNGRDALRVQFPFLVRPLYRLRLWLREVLTPLVFADLLLFFQIGRNPTPAREFVVREARILGQFLP